MSLECQVIHIAMPDFGMPGMPGMPPPAFERPPEPNFEPKSRIQSISGAGMS